MEYRPSSPTGSTVNCQEAIESYTRQRDWRVKANANNPYSHGGLVSALAGKVIANYWLNEVYSPEEGAAHRNGDYHIHDLDCLTGYCAGWSLRALLTEGLNGVPGKLSCAPPAHFDEALHQMVHFLCLLQAEWAGAQAFSSFDTYLAPYVFKDQLSYEQVKKAIRQFVDNLNVPGRWGQTPFTNVTLDITVPPDLRSAWPTRGKSHLLQGNTAEVLLEQARARGKDHLEEMTYADFVPEMSLIGRAFYAVLTEGDASGQPFTFPIPTVNITEDFDWDCPVAEALLDNTAKVGSSYFQNFVGSQYKLDEKGNRIPNPEAYAPHAVRSMCCRLQLDLRVLEKRGNGLFGAAEMTGSLGVVTLNMARLGYRFKGDEAGLLQEVTRLMNLGKGTLEKKRQFIQAHYDAGLYPYTKRYLPHLRNHFSTLGVNGMHEMVRNFTGDAADVTTPAGQALCTLVLDHMRALLQDFQQATGHLYNLEATPAEGATYRFAKEDRKRYPGILQAGEGEHIYYTNSSQLPVDYTDDPFQALTLQDELQTKYTGGTVLHLYINERLEDGAACKQLLRKVLTRYRLPYITVTPVFSVCPSHGALSGSVASCPTCGAETAVWTRVMGYYRPVDGFNLGKQGEHWERQYFAMADAAAVA